MTIRVGATKRHGSQDVAKMWGLSCEKFLSCAVGHQRMAHVQFMPFEDTGVSMLAGICVIIPSWQANAKVEIHCYKSHKTRKRFCDGGKIPKTQLRHMPAREVKYH